MCNGNESFHAKHAAYGIGMAFDRDKFRFDLRNGRFPDRTVFPPHVPTKLRNIIKKCMETTIANRYQSAIDVANALAGVDGQTLDWRLSGTPDTRVWTKNDKGTQYEFMVDKAAKATCSKTVADGQPRKVGDGCKASMSEQEIQRFLGSH
jgi:hypothetical protein